VKIVPYPAADGSEFWEGVWEADRKNNAPSRGTIIALHGMGSASSEFAPLGEYFSRHGWTVRAPNQRCHGHDPVLARRGHAFSYADFQADFVSYWQHWQNNEEALSSTHQVFLFGESLGGLLAANYLGDDLLHPRPAGLILSAPVMELAHPNPPWTRHAVKILAALLPRLVISPALFIQGKEAPVPLTRDQAYQEYIQTAPHRVNSFTIRFTGGVAGLMERTQKIGPRLQLPVLLLNGADDVFIRPDQSAAWFATVGSRDKTHIVFPGSMHLLLHELNTVEVLETIEAWMEARQPDEE